MLDEVHIGWLESDDYRRAAEAAGVVELGEPGESPPTGLSPEVLGGRFEDDNPPGAPR